MRQAGLVLQKPASDIATYANRSMNFVNMWDASLTHDGFTGFAQRRFQVGYPSIRMHRPLLSNLAIFVQNGTFAFSPPDACSPVDPSPHSCARGTDNNVGFYECTFDESG